MDNTLPDETKANSSDLTALQATATTPMERRDEASTEPASKKHKKPPNTDAAPAHTPHPAMSHKKRAILTGFFLGLFLVIGAATAYGLLSYHGSFGAVKVAGIPITRTGDKQSQVDALTEQLKAVKFTVKDKAGATTVFTPVDAGITYDTAQTIVNARQAKEQGKLLHRLQWWRNQTVPVVFGVDKLKLDAFIEEKLTQIAEKPVNATLFVEGAEVRTTAEKPGTGFKVTNARSMIENAAREGRSELLLMTPQAIPATITLKDVEPHKAKIIEALDQPITFSIKGRQYTPSKSTVGSWVEPMTTETKTTSLLYNSGEIEAYLDGIAKPHIRTVKNGLTMTGSDGMVITLVTGQDGTDISGKQDVAKDVATRLLKPQPINIELTVSETKHTVTAAESYEKWLIADITNKRIDAYENDRLVNSFPISAGAPATPTVIGQFKIHGKTRKQNMRGYNADGSTYFQPNVEWNMFFQGSYAIHGNYWRPADWFGRVNSSHGCIGLQNHHSQWIYEWAPVGTPVITHL